MQGQDIVLCIITDIVVRRCFTGCGCGDVSIAVGRPVAGGRYLHTTYIKHLSDRRSRQRRDGQHRSYTDANLVQFSTLHRADRAIRIDFFLGAEGFTGTFFRLCVGRSCRVSTVLCVADFTNKGAGRSLCGGNIAAGFIMAVIAGFRVGQPAATLVVFMGTGNFRCPLGVAAAFVMLGVVFTQPAFTCDNTAVLYACFGKRHCRQQRHDHAQADKRRK